MINEKKTAEEELNFAIENLDDARYSFAVFVDAIKKWHEKIKES